MVVIHGLLNCMWLRNFEVLELHNAVILSAAKVLGGASHYPWADGPSVRVE